MWETRCSQRNQSQEVENQVQRWGGQKAPGAVREQGDLCGLLGSQKGAGERWDLIELEGWVVGMCAARKEREGPSRSIFLLIVLHYMAGASGKQGTHFSTDAQLLL